jgi:hypothetical protein
LEGFSGRLDLPAPSTPVQQAHTTKGDHHPSDTQIKKTLNTDDPAPFTATEQWHWHSINRAILYTDGAQYVSENAAKPTGGSTRPPSFNCYFRHRCLHRLVSPTPN